MDYCNTAHEAWSIHEHGHTCSSPSGATYTIRNPTCQSALVSYESCRRWHNFGVHLVLTFVQSWVETYSSRSERASFPGSLRVVTPSILTNIWCRLLWNKHPPLSCLTLRLHNLPLAIIVAHTQLPSGITDSGEWVWNENKSFIMCILPWIEIAQFCLMCSKHHGSCLDY